MAESNELQDLLRVEGINCKGFGIIPKAVMHDTELSIEAKTIYSYFCSFAGNGTTAFPSRDTILFHLKMTKDYYYKNFRQLEEQGFLRVERTGSFPYKNIYTLVPNPKKFEDKQTEYNKAYSQIKFSGLKAFGFGMIPKAVMIDDRLDVKAKGIYSYFCSYAGSGIAAFPKVDKILYHLKIGRQAYYKYYNQLISCNYITVVQRKAEGGRFTVSDYYLNEAPDSALVDKSDIEEPCDDSQDNGESGLNSAFHPCDDLQDNAPCDDLPDNDSPDNDSPDNDRQDTNINSTNKNNVTKISLYKNQSIIQEPNEGMSEESPKEFSAMIYAEMKAAGGIPYNYKADRRKMTEAVHILTSWETFSKNGYRDEMQQEIYLMFVECLIDMACAEGLANYKGSMISYAKVIDKINSAIETGTTYDYMSLSSFTDTFISEFEAASKQREISSYVPYMKSCIWNCLVTHKVKFHATVDKLLHGFYD